MKFGRQMQIVLCANDAQNVRADTARGKDNDQQNISEMIT